MVEEGGLLASLDYLWGECHHFLGLLPQARGGSMALQSSSTEGGTSSSAMTGRGVSVTTFSWSIALDKVLPNFPFLCLCDDFAGCRLEGCNLGGSWTEGFLHAIIHGVDVATISGEFDIVVLAAFIRDHPFCLEWWIHLGWRSTLLPTR